MDNAEKFRYPVGRADIYIFSISTLRPTLLWSRARINRDGVPHTLNSHGFNLGLSGLGPVQLAGIAQQLFVGIDSRVHAMQVRPLFQLLLLRRHVNDGVITAMPDLNSWACSLIVGIAAAEQIAPLQGSQVARAVAAWQQVRERHRTLIGKAGLRCTGCEDIRVSGEHDIRQVPT